MQTLKETRVEISTMEQEWQLQSEQRLARKRKIRYIDILLDEFERLNLHDDGDVPAELQHQVLRLVNAEQHPIAERNEVPTAITIGEWMEALYDVQDALMLPLVDEVEKIGTSARYN